MTFSTLNPRPVWGLAGVILGVIAVALVVLSLSSVFAEPQPDAATRIGEIAAEIRKSAARSLMGIERPAPDTPTVTVATVTTISAPVLAAVAAICGAIGLFRRESRGLPLLALGFGTSAFMMQYVLMLALIIGGVCLLVALLNNLDSILNA